MGKKRNRSAILFGVLALAWIGVLFFFSGQNGDSSQGLSRGLVHRLFAPLLRRGISEDDLNFVLRKGAHMFIFAAEAFLTQLSLGRLWDRLRSCAASAGFCFLLACLNEFHQYFSGGRTASFGDVLYDTFGALIGVLLAAYLLSRTSKYRPDKR